MTLTEVLERIRGYRALASTELEIQNHLALVLEAEGIPHQREYFLGEAGRIDFYLPPFRAGLEVKIAGSPNAVLRQLFRYALVPEIDELILFTRRARHSEMPDRIGAIRLHVVCPWEGGL